MGGYVPDMGSTVFTGFNSKLKECIGRCNKRQDCQSFIFCDADVNPASMCFLKDKRLSGSESAIADHYCTSYYKNCDNGNFIRLVIE